MAKKYYLTAQDLIDAKSFGLGSWCDSGIAEFASICPNGLHLTDKDVKKFSTKGHSLQYLSFFFLFITVSEEERHIYRTTTYDDIKSKQVIYAWYLRAKPRVKEFLDKLEKIREERRVPTWKNPQSF